MERRDELSAHTFARKRTLAAFLQPESRVSDEEAPRPVRAMMPSTVMSVVLVVGCIAWGAIAPSAPPGWDTAGEHIIVDTDSTTRYVVLAEEGKDGKKVKQLHPVLNFASAKLVLDKGKGEVIEVAGEDIDASGIARGATIGIPYAPDRLPPKADAEEPKEWAVCEKPGAGSGGQPQQGVFVLGGHDKDALKGKSRLAQGEALFVQDAETGDQYVVDGNGTKLMLDGLEGKTNTVNRSLLTKLVLRDPGQPQMVSPQWLSTLRPGDPVEFPDLTSGAGTPVQFSGAAGLPEEARRVGMVLKSTASGVDFYYVVVGDGLQQTSALYAKLMMGGLDLQEEPVSVKQLEVAETEAASSDVETGGKGWPEDVLTQVNRAAEGIGSTSRTVSCSVYSGKIKNGAPELAAWAGNDYPANIVAGTASAYVSPGSGLLYQEFTGTGGGGQRYLLTDSGLRYALGGKASARLDYDKVKVAGVPQNWSALLPKGPTLDEESASQEQGM